MRYDSVANNMGLSSFRHCDRQTCDRHAKHVYSICCCTLKILQIKYCFKMPGHYENAKYDYKAEITGTGNQSEM